jgi:hypothetical protein
MRRTLTIAALVSLWTVVAAAGPALPVRTIDLNAPGAFETLQQSRPAHFEKVRQILEGVPQRRDPEVRGWMLVSFGARDVDYPPVLLTSFPPQRQLSFVLDDTRYNARVTLTNARFSVVPLR